MNAPAAHTHPPHAFAVTDGCLTVGGVPVRGHEHRSSACAVEGSLAAPLREHEPPVVGIVRDGRLLLDCRTLADAELDEVAAAVAACR